ncbi:collagen alpha-1(I) chain [Gadus morhua]|uniref:collagen alpha-1(I) chain n=1 Tax=Gadus morhua TaxID=8049 RepID=UPI0011B576F9|nr:collagen alpha-1(I) chain-like [Gadus morhua]
MGCRCCRMIKSYIYDPSAVGEPGKSELSGSGGRGSLYQPRGPPGGAAGDRGGDRQKEGVSNLAYSKSNEGTLKLEADNNHVNRLPEHQPPPRVPGGGALYIIQPQAPGPRWTTEEAPRPSQVPVYPEPPGGGRRSEPGGWDTADEDEGVGGTPEYRGDGEGSALSVETLTSTASGSSAGDAPPRWPKAADASTAESGISMTKSEDEEGEGEGRRRQEESEDVRSVTDSMVAEALAALEAATAGEEFE